MLGVSLQPSLSRGFFFIVLIYGRTSYVSAPTDGRTTFALYRVLSFLVLFTFVHIMVNGPLTRKLTRGNSTWVLTRFSDSLFIAKNSFGKKHVFRSGWEMTHFEDFLLRNGFAPIEPKRSLATLVRK